jgi:hypothetical protein
MLMNDDVLTILEELPASSFQLPVQTALFLLRASSDNQIEERHAPS